VFALNRTLVAFAACALTLVGATAHATVPADLCTGNPCTVTGSKTIAPPVVLDFGDADLVFAGSAIVTVGAGAARDVQINARSITLQPGARILGGGDLATVVLNATGGALRLQAAGSTKARIDLSGNQGGSVLLQATGDIEIAGPITTAGSGTESSRSTRPAAPSRCPISSTRAPVAAARAAARPPSRASARSR
jgi:hypothetical protein